MVRSCSPVGTGAQAPVLSWYSTVKESTCWLCRMSSASITLSTC
ncbi:hypothetical protein AB0A71_19900 [Kitasatospora aureofaciens]